MTPIVTSAPTLVLPRALGAGVGTATSNGTTTTPVRGVNVKLDPSSHPFATGAVGIVSYQPRGVLGHPPALADHRVTTLVAQTRLRGGVDRLAGELVHVGGETGAVFDSEFYKGVVLGFCHRIGFHPTRRRGDVSRVEGGARSSRAGPHHRRALRLRRGGEPTRRRGTGGGLCHEP